MSRTVSAKADPKASVRSVPAAERRLPPLANALKGPLEGLLFEQVVVLSFGHRGWALYQGVRHAIRGGQLYAAGVTLRALLDVVILTRWMEEDPGLRARLWMAEDARHRLVHAANYRALERNRGRPVPTVFTPAEVAEMKAEVRKARAGALAAGLPVSDSGSLLPSVEAMAMSVDHLWEVYNIAYRTLSASTHAGALSFVRDEIRLRRDGTHLAPRAPWDGWSLRALGVPTITMLLATVSRQVGLGVEAECDAVRLAVVFPMS